LRCRIAGTVVGTAVVEFDDTDFLANFIITDIYFDSDHYSDHDANSYSYSCSHTNANANAHTHTNANAHTHTNSYSHTNAYSDADANKCASYTSVYGEGVHGN